MKANELMIGDWVSIGASNYYQVEEIRKECGEYRFYLKGTSVFATESEIEPIPLKKIHLTKNGFKAREETDDTEFYYYECYGINVIFDEGISEENIPPIIFLTIEFAEKSIAMPIEYVHELQQAMRIMGCDKEIEL